MINCYGVLLLFVTAVGIYAILLNIQELVLLSHYVSKYYRSLNGIAFDCTIRPLVSHFAICIFTFFTILLALCLLISSFCCSPFCARFFENSFLYGLYILYGPILLITCMYFLFNIKDYSFTCTMPEYKKEYGYRTLIAVSLLAFIAIVVTFLWCAKKLIKRLTQTLRNDENCFTRFINSFVCKSINSEDEIEYSNLNLDEEVERSQL